MVGVFRPFLPTSPVPTLERLMLHLQSATSERWLQQVDENLDDVLIDHAHCEKKAAACALQLLNDYITDRALCDAMSEIVNEELEHFGQVLDLLEKRGVRFRIITPSSYGKRLHALIRKEEPGRAIDRLLVAGLIEARSCERFSRLREHIQDRELAEFYGSLFESEARHHSAYVRIAKRFGSDEEVRARLDELSREEARIIEQGDDFARMHS